jgi:hypothetical protein
MDRLIDRLDATWWGRVLGLMLLVGLWSLLASLISDITGIDSSEILVGGSIAFCVVVVFVGYQSLQETKKAHSQLEATWQHEVDDHSLRVTQSKTQAAQVQADAATIRRLAKQVGQARQRIEFIQGQLYPHGTPQRSEAGSEPKLAAPAHRGDGGSISELYDE